MSLRWLRATTLAAAFLPFGAGAALAGQAAAPAADAGIPVQNDLVKQKCGGCHRPDAQGRMTRISYRRASPEGWELTIKRMIGLNGLALTGPEARTILKYLSDNHGLAPEEIKPARWEAERRADDFKYEGDAATQATCTVCHSLGRVMTERRTKDDWNLLIQMHRGYYPLVDNQPISPEGGFRRTRRADQAPGADNRHPMDKVVDHAAKVWPLITPEWTAWSAGMQAPKMAGKWAVSGYQTGYGPVFGEFTITVDPSAPDAYSTVSDLMVGGKKVVRNGKATLYTGYQWRGRTQGDGEKGTWREVMLLERNGREMTGRWFTGAYDETGIEVTLTRVGADPILTGTSTMSLKAGSSQTVSFFGANLPSSIDAAAVVVGGGIKVNKVTPVSAGRVDLDLAVAADAKDGPRDVTIALATKPSAFVVYSKVDGIKVLPEANLARVGGAVYPKQFAQFEAVAYANGPDGKPNTKDDLILGPVDAKFTAEEYTSTFGDDDLQFSGNIDPKGFFTPALDGPNPERSGNRNNIGDLWVVAQYTPPGTTQTLKARGFLLISPPVFMRWYGPLVDAGGEK